MEIRAEYIQYILDYSYKISKGMIGDIIVDNCYNEVEDLKRRICSSADLCKINENDRINRIYTYLQKIQKTSNYIRLIEILRQVEKFLQKNDSLNVCEKESIQDLDKYIRNDLKIVGFSAKNISRIFQDNIDKHITTLVDYMIIPKLKADYNFRTSYLVATKQFLKKKEESLKNSPFYEGIKALEMGPEESEPYYERYVHAVFDILKKLEVDIVKQEPREEMIWHCFQPYVKRACRNCSCITEEIIKKIKDEVIDDLIKELNFYKCICKMDENDVLEYPYFKCIGLYHISHIFRSYMEKSEEKNAEYKIIAFRICSYAAAQFQVVLHPECKISAPCGLAGKRIFVGTGSIIESDCYLEENVIVESDGRAGENCEDSDYITKVGKRTTIKKDAMLLAGTCVGAECIIDQEVILVRDTVDDNQLVQSSGFRKELWNREEYLRYGGYCYEEG